jgi:hypothetical protein
MNKNIDKHISKVRKFLFDHNADMKTFYSMDIIVDELDK